VDKVKVAVVGCGTISDIYMSNMHSGKFEILELVACSDMMTQRMEASAAKYGCKAMTLEEICADPQIEMVVNLTPPAAHYPVNKQCLLAGKHVFCEKMIAVELWQGEELVALAQEKGLRLGAAPDTFLGASVQTAKYIVDIGLIGMPLSCRASVSRNYGVFGEILPHLYKNGGGIALDMGGYYLTALAAILGPAESVAAFTSVFAPERINTRVGPPLFGQQYTLEVPNVLTAAIRYQNGVLGTLHMNSETVLDEKYTLEIYGTEGIVSMGNPNNIGDPVVLKRHKREAVEFPLSHGFEANSRGLGAAEMAWSIRAGRPHRASKEMAYHVFEILNGITVSAQNGQFYQVVSTFDIPAALPTGFIGSGKWTRKEESALIQEKQQQAEIYKSIT